MSKKLVIVRDDEDARIKKAFETRQAFFTKISKTPGLNLIYRVIILVPAVLAFVIFTPFFATHGFPGVFYAKTDIYIKLLSDCFIIFSLLLIGYLIKLSKEVPPKDKLKKDIWLWNSGKKGIIYIFLLIVSYSFSNYLEALLADESGYLALATIATICTLFCITFLLIVFPKLYFSRFLNFVGNICFLVAWPLWVLVVFDTIDKIFSNSEFTFLVKTPILILSAVTYIFFIIKNVQASESKILRRLILNIVPPKKLLNAYQTLEQKLIDEEVSRKVIKQLLNRGPQAQIELLEQLSRLHNKKSPWRYLLIIIFTLSCFIASSVGQVFIQDVIYHEHIRPIIVHATSLLTK